MKPKRRIIAINLAASIVGFWKLPSSDTPLLCAFVGAGFLFNAAVQAVVWKINNKEL